MEGHGFHRKKQPLINRSLLPTKLLNLFLSAGEANLLPFLPMYFRFIGLTAIQSGILGCTRHLVSIWASPLLRMLAEKTNKRKFLFLALLLAAVISNISLGLTNTVVSTSNFRAYNCEKMAFNHSISRVNGSNFSQLNASTNKSGKIATTGTVNKSIVTVSPLGNFTQLNDKDSTINKANRLFDTGITRNLNQTSKNSNGTNLISSELLTHRVNNSPTIKESLHNNLTNFDVQSKWYHLYGFQMDHTFKVLLTLVFFSELFSSSARGISRSIFSDILRQSKGSHLRSHVWTSLGTVLGGGVLIMAIGYHRCDFGLKNSFYLHFYIFAIFGAVSFVLGAVLKEQEQKSLLALRFGRTFAYLCCDVNMICFLAVLLVLGMAESLMYNYMMWYLQDIGASIIVMGVIVVTTAFSEIPMLCISKHLIRCFGHHWVIFVSLFCYGGRFLYFSYCKNPWVIIPIELLRGLSYTTVHSACGSYAASVSLHGTEKTLKVIFSTVYHGLGMGIGGIAVALLYQIYGPTVVFRCAAGVCGVYALVFALLQCILVLPDGDRKGGKVMEYQQIKLDGERGDFPFQEDWLMEALQAEEDGEDETHFMKINE
ncbi:hypothetical protein ACROYT_G037672 [Oculina patagonica]